MFLLFRNPHSINSIRASSIRLNNSIYVQRGHHDFLPFWRVCKMNLGNQAHQSHHQIEIPVSSYFRVSSFLENMFIFLTILKISSHFKICNQTKSKLKIYSVSLSNFKRNREADDVRHVYVRIESLYIFWYKFNNKQQLANNVKQKFINFKLNS